METEKSKWEKMHEDLWKEKLDELWGKMYESCTAYNIAIKQSQPNLDELRKRTYDICSAYNIMLRGYYICKVNENKVNGEKMNGQRNILIVGINPSFSEKDSLDSISYELNDTMKGPHWKKVKYMLQNKEMDLDLYEDAAYVDILDCRETDKDLVLSKIICNHDLDSYVVAQVKATQKIIEEVIQPKVIIIMYKDVWAFFGKDKRFTWMGYEFENINNEENIDNNVKYEVCRIKGFSNRKDRINPDLKDTNLKGCIVCFTNSSQFAAWNTLYPTPEKINQWVAMATLNK